MLLPAEGSLVGIQNTDDGDVRDTRPIDTTAWRGRHRFMVRDEYKPVGMNQIDAELARTIAEELVKPERPSGRNLR